MGRIIGIDLGTTNSVAAYWVRKRAKVIENDVTRSYILPSAVTVNEFGQRVVGQDAKDRLGSGSTNVIYSIKRFMGMDFDDPNSKKALENIGYRVRASENGEVEVLLHDKYYSPIEISAMILQQLKSDAELQLGEAVTHAVITVPAYFGQRQKDATREAGKLAGLHVARIINEPTAAALAFGIESHDEEPKFVLVYDFGGGTFDVSILAIAGQTYDVLNIDGDNFLGGDDLDKLMMERILAEQNDKRLAEDSVTKCIIKSRAEQAKIELSRVSCTQILHSFQSGIGKTVNINITIERSEFENMIADSVDKSLAIVDRALAGAYLERDDISHVLLVGGTTRIPYVRKKLKEMFGAEKVQIDVDPMQCVALGAAVQSVALTQEEIEGEALRAAEITGVAADDLPANEITGIDSFDLPTITITDVTSKHIGIKTSDTDAFAVVIEKGTVIPTTIPLTRLFFTNRFDQREYVLPVYEVEAPSKKAAEEQPLEPRMQIGVIQNNLLPAGLPENTPIMVEMSIDRDGILYVSSYVSNDKEHTFVEKSFTFGRSTKHTSSNVLEGLEFHANMFHDIINSPELRKYLAPGQRKRAADLISQAQCALNDGDQHEGAVVLNQMEQLRREFPAPTEDVFWASVLSVDSDISAVDRNRLQQIMRQMEQAISRNEIDTANQHLHQLRQTTVQIIDKLPANNLLRKSR